VAVSDGARSYRPRTHKFYQVTWCFVRTTAKAGVIGEVLTVGDNFTPFVETSAGIRWRGAG